jgi:hypothetical protein
MVKFHSLIAQRPGSKPLIEALALGVVGSFFIRGWWDVSKVAGEVRDPSRTMRICLRHSVCDGVYLNERGFYLPAPMEL